MSLNIKIYQRQFQPHAGKPATAFISGLKRHGLTAEWLHQTRYKPCDLAVIWGVRFPHIIQGQKECGGDYLVIERGYFRDRMAYCSLGFNGLNGRAEFLAKDMPPKRWFHHGVKIEKWKTGGDYILLMGQVEGDQSLNGKNIRHWYERVMTRVKELTDMPVYYRPHPQSRRFVGRLRCAGYKTDSLEESLSGAMCAITYNSNSGVDAVLNGVPVIAMDRGSMAWDVAQHEITMDMYLPDRMQWLFDLAYKQWTLEEIANGEAWDHLKRKYEKPDEAKSCCLMNRRMPDGC
ncbi:MAG: hypothetical protein R6U40_07485 [Desulfobacterales bacterium]